MKTVLIKRLQGGGGGSILRYRALNFEVYL